VLVLHAGTDAALEMLPIPAAGGRRTNPQGIAVSPDGATLYVSDNRPGGAVQVFDLRTRAVVTTVWRGAAAIPMGVAASPDGHTAYFAFAGAAREVAVFDRDTLDATGSFATCAGPTGVAVTPDGAKVYVTCDGAAAVTVYTVAGGALASVPVGAGPSGVAISPDGQRAWVACAGAGAVSLLSTATDTVVASIPVAGGPTGIAISPDGRRTYVTAAQGGGVVEIGGPLTLTVEKLGTGIGTVTSSPDGLDCGLSCRSSFDLGASVTLTAVPDSGSAFDGWGGDCTGPTVVMNGSRRCTALFTRLSTGGGGGRACPAGASPSDCAIYCFVATAAWGSPLAPEVQALRDFRDRHLLTSAPGRAVVAFYYRHSPPLAAWLGRHEGARTLVRWGLTPVVLAVSHPDGALLLVLLPLAAVGAWRLRRRRRHELPLLALLALSLASWGCVPPTPAPIDTTAPRTSCSPGGGTYGAVQYLTLAADERATIYYSLEGTALPAGFATASSGRNPVYWIRIGPGTTTLRYFAVDAAGNHEAPRTETFVIEEGP
jgi:YVTN family beta-propeller protein